MKKTARISIAALALATLLSPIVWTGHASARADTVASSTTSSATTELSGASGDGAADGSFGTWRGSALDITNDWSDDNANSVQFWPLQSSGDLHTWNKPMDVAVGAIDSGETWQAAASGAYDSRWAASLTKLKSLRAFTTATTYIRFAHEMNGNWYAWSVNSSNYTYFDAAWKRYRALQQQIFPQAKLVFSVNKESSYSSGIAWTKYFPGNQYVDVLSVDYYNQYPYVATDADWNSSITATDSFGAPKGLATYLAYAKSQSLPLAISEWSGNAGFGDSPVFINHMLSYFKANGGNAAGRIVYDILFNVPGYNKAFQLYGPDATMPLSSAAYKAFFTAASASTGTGSGSAGSGSSTVTAPATTDTLSATGSLAAGAQLTSSDGRYTFAAQGDGNLVVYNSAHQAIWASSTSGSGSELDLQGDGNLVLYSSSRRALWNSVTSGAGAGASLVMQTDGNLVLYNSQRQAIWNSKGFAVAATSVAAPVTTPTTTDTLSTGGSLAPGSSLVSVGGQYTFAFQGDSNLVVYNASHAAIWNSSTVGRSATELDLQSDANLVLYTAAHGAAWNTVTSGRGSLASLVMQPDGNLVLYNAAHQALWNSKGY